MPRMNEAAVNKVLGMISLCRRAGRLTLGMDAAAEKAWKGEARLLLLAEDLSPRSDEVEMSVCSELFLDYCILGGMPAVVREFISKGTFEGSLDIQRQLIADYREDIRKCAEGIDQTRILNVFDHILPSDKRRIG